MHEKDFTPGQPGARKGGFTADPVLFAQLRELFADHLILQPLWEGSPPQVLGIGLMFQLDDTSTLHFTYHVAFRHEDKLRAALCSSRIPNAVLERGFISANVILIAQQLAADIRAGDEKLLANSKVITDLLPGSEA